MTQRSERSVQLDVTILGREYKVACKESERAELAEAVTLLDGRMREIRDTGKVASIDRIAVMAALNLAHEALRARREPPAAPSVPKDVPVDDAVAQRRIRSMQTAIDQVLSGQDKLL
ncbi:MAG: cell division protein ZapA [Burkholderiales bacterium]|nr:cell division protein ZapA [Burkholderiales bacterium]